MRRARGFTLVEMMVAMAVGLVLALAVALSMLSMGQQFRVVSAVSAAQVNAQMALSLIDQTARSAGAGLYSNGQPLCQAFNAWKNGAIVSNGTPLLPARIVDGGSAGASDRIVFTAASPGGALTGLPVLDAMATAGASVVASNSVALAANDLIIVGVPGSTTAPCTLMQVTATPAAGTACGGNAAACQTIPRTSNAAYNPSSGTFATEPRYGFATAGAVTGPAVVVRMGTSLQQRAFAVLCDTLVQYNAFTDNPSCSTGPLTFGGGADALVADVVLMHAQYGISASASSNIVTNWVDASGATWASPTATNAGRIKAVRVVIVSRSKEAASEQVTAASCTNTGSVVNTGPCSFDDAEAPPIDLSGVSLPSGGNWRKYRYRVTQAVIPLRNVIWSN
jgi:type IV pilus assembly protein PilW